MKRIMITALLGSIASASPASAECALGWPDMTQDNAVASSWDCAGEGPYLWSEFKFENWGGNYGGDTWTTRCSVYQPARRTLNAYWLIRNAAPGHTVGTGRLNRAWTDIIPRLTVTRAGCTDSGGAVATFWNGWTDHVTLYRPFWNGSLVFRAGVLVHEARHNDKGHDSSSCLDGSSCDSSWGYDGANRWQVEWWSDFSVGGRNSTPAMVQNAIDDANYRLDRRFASVPDLKVYPGVGLVQRCYPNCAPPPPTTTCASQGYCGTAPNCYECGCTDACACAVPKDEDDEAALTSAGPVCP